MERKLGTTIASAGKNKHPLLSIR